MMRGKSAFNRLDDAFVEDILAASDEDILAEFREVYGDPDAAAKSMRDAFERSVVASNKHRLAIAKAGVKGKRSSSLRPESPMNAKDARRILKDFMSQHRDLTTVTMAARKEQELSDLDVIGMVEELIELGLLSFDEGNA